MIVFNTEYEARRFNDNRINNIKEDLSMKLVNQVTTFETYDLLCSFMEVSRFKISRRAKEYKATVSINPSFYRDVAMTHFSLGRQTGKTSAVAKYANETKENLIVVCHNGAMKREFERSLTNYTGNVYVVNPASSMDWVMKFRGLRLGDVEMIFEECSDGIINKTLTDMAPFLGRELNLVGVVAIGERY